MLKLRSFSTAKSKGVNISLVAVHFIRKPTLFFIKATMKCSASIAYNREKEMGKLRQGEIQCYWTKEHIVYNSNSHVSSL